MAAVSRIANRIVRRLPGSKRVVVEIVRDRAETGWRETLLDVIECCEVEATPGAIANYFGITYSAAWYRLSAIRCEVDRILRDRGEYAG